MSILVAKGLKKSYRSAGGIFLRGRKMIRAVDGVDIELERGKTLGLVGESGCGKSTLARLLLRLEEPTAGTLEIDGNDFLSLKGGQLRRARRKIQMIFQDPYSSLNPRLTIGSTIAEGIRIHRLARGADVERRVGELLDQVGLPRTSYSRYPHEFSGGQRQRVGIARALAVEPDIIVADEPVSALDVSVQAQIINLLADLQRDLGLTYLFVAHDLGVVEHVSSRISVMYLGRIVESAPATELFIAPLHPYTEGLLASIPSAEPGRRVKAGIAGDVPSSVDIPAGCSFHTRCPRAFSRCGTETPLLREVSPGRRAACWLHEK